MDTLKILSIYDRLYLKKNKFMFKVYQHITPDYILVKSSNRPRVFLPIFGKAIRTISISFAFPNRPAYQ